MTLLVATRSVGKEREIRRLLADSGLSLRFPDDAGVPWRGNEETLETGSTFEANALRKAEYFARKTGLPTVADDSGLEVIALGGAPGIRSKRFSGVEGPEEEVDRANNAELLRRLAGAPEAKRRARYLCVLVYFGRPDAVPQAFRGICNGRILEAARGTSGFGYDPVFLSDDLGKSFGEATPEEKDGVSHRGQAFRELAAQLGKSGV